MPVDEKEDPPLDADPDALRLRANGLVRHYLDGYLTKHELVSQLAENPLESVPVVDEIPDLQKEVDELRRHIRDGNTIVIGSYC